MGPVWEFIAAIIEIIWKVILNQAIKTIHGVFGYRDLASLETLVLFVQGIWPAVKEIIEIILENRADFYERLRLHEQRAFPDDAIDLTDEEDTEWEDFTDAEDVQTDEEPLVVVN